MTPFERRLALHPEQRFYRPDDLVPQHAERHAAHLGGGGRLRRGRCCGRCIRRRGRRIVRCIRCRCGLIRFNLGRQVLGELADDLAGDILDHAGAATVLRNRSGQLQIGMNFDRRSRVRGFQMKRDIGIRAAASLGV